MYRGICKGTGKIVALKMMINQTKNPYAIRGQAQRQTMNKTVLSPVIQRDSQVHTTGKNAKILNKPHLIDGKTLDTK